MSDADPAKLLDELRKAKENLSEVIDECVFLEGQCEQTEKRLKAEVLDRDRRIADISAALMDMIRYTSLLERKVIAPAFVTLDAAMKRAPAIETCRDTSLRRVISVVKGRKESPRPRGTTKKSSRRDATREDENRDELLLSVDEACTLVSNLLKEKVNLTAKIDEVAFHVSNAVAKRGPTPPSEADSLRGSMDNLHENILNLTHGLGGCGEVGQGAEGEACELVVPPIETEEDVDKETIKRLRAVITEQENTINRLQSLDQLQLQATGGARHTGLGEVGENSEASARSLARRLATAEEKCMVLERQSTREREELHAELAYLRNSSKEEREECKAVIERLTVELEILVAENAVMRKRIKDRKQPRNKSS